MWSHAFFQFLAVILLCSAISRATVAGPDKVYSSGDGRFRWVDGENFVSVYDAVREISRKIRLPSNIQKPSSRKVLFANSGKYFCLVDEYSQEIGLHLGTRKGAKNAKALVIQSTLRLIDEHGNTLWLRNMPDSHVVGKSDKAHAVRISNDGTLAILLQDIDPYDKARPVLIVMDPRGIKRLRLDYTSWTSVEEFMLSKDGKYLVVRGFGLIPQEDHWEKALGFYQVETKKTWILPIPDAEDIQKLQAVDNDGWACCVSLGGKLLSLHPEGRRKPVTEPK